MVCTVDDVELVNESRDCVDCVDAEDERRSDERRLLAERRRRMVWKRGILISVSNQRTLGKRDWISRWRLESWCEDLSWGSGLATRRL